MSTPTASAMYGRVVKNASPPTDRTIRISSVAYATEDSASLANTGSAIRLGSRV